MTVKELKLLSINLVKEDELEARWVTESKCGLMWIARSSVLLIRRFSWL